MLRLGFVVLLLSVTFSLEAQEDYRQYLELSYEKINSLMMIEYQKGSYEKAIPLMQAGRAKAKVDYGEQDSTFISFTNNLGLFYELTGQFDKALPLFNQAIRIQEEVLGKEHPNFASLLNNLAGVHEKMGNYDKALPLYIQAINIREKLHGKEHPEIATSLTNLAVLYYSMGSYDKALSLYTQAKNIREKVFGKEHPDFANSLNNIASLYKRMGDYDKALPLFIQAKNIRERVLGKEHPAFATSLNNLAMLHQRMGNYDKALPLYTQAKNIYREVLGEKHPNFANSLNNIAALHRGMDNYDKALPLYTQAKNIYKEVLGKEHPFFAAALGNLAAVHSRMGNYDKALLLLIQAKNIYKEGLGKAHPHFIESLNDLAFVHASMGNYDEAWQLLGQAMNSSSGSTLNHSFDKAWTDGLQQAPYPSNGHLKQMLKSLQYAYTFLEKDKRIENAAAKQTIVADLASTLLAKFRQQLSNEKDKLRMLSQSNDWLQKSLGVLDSEQDKQKAFELSDQNKSVLLYQATQSEAAYRLGNLPDSLVYQNKAMLQKKRQLQAQLLEKKEEEVKNKLRDELIDINQDLDAFEALVKKDYPKYYQLKYQEVATKAGNIQTLLDEKTALIEYAIGDSVVHIFCVTKADVVWEKVFVENKQLSTYIQQLHSSLSDYQTLIENQKRAYQQYTEPAYWFYDKLLAPVLTDNKQLNKLIIVTDGELGHLPFETFLVEKAPEQLSSYKDLHYLLNDYRISYNYSASLWKENKEAAAPENNGQILGVAANYASRMDSATSELRSYGAQSLRQQLTPLPDARQEVEILAATYDGFFAFDSLASERVVKEKAPDFAILHFATHGLLDEKRPILSSLALTENNDSTEDNFWQAYEISKMELNADLVILSACETGFGKFETGNGIASLARSFMYAGAPSLIVSLWQVNDQATKEIMQRLYQNLAKGQAIDEALRQAKLEYIQLAKVVAAHPAFWSPFIQMGKTEPVEIKAKGGLSTWVFVGLGAVLLLVLGVVWMRRKRKA